MGMIDRTVVVCAVLLTGAAVFLPRVGRAKGDHADVQLTRAGSLAEPVTESFEVVSPMQRLEVELACELEHGSASWQLLDPRQEVRWSGTRSAGEGRRASASVTLPAEPGVWRLVLTPAAARGTYRLRWRGND